MSGTVIDWDATFRAVREMSEAFRRERARLAARNARVQWELRILFTDDPKERRRLRRDMAREYRRPALIHKGGKP